MRLRIRKLAAIFILVLVLIAILIAYAYVQLIQHTSEYITILQDVEISHSAVQLLDLDAPRSVGQLLNLRNFSYIIENNSCAGIGAQLTAIIIVHSYAGNDALRAAQRNACAQTTLAMLGMRRIFVLAALPAHETFVSQAQLNDEQARYGDLLQGDFIEAYRNLSYKHVMALRWAATSCTQASYIIKADDDTIFDAYYLRRQLHALAATGSAIGDTLLAGFVMHNVPVQRQRNNKWHVTRQEYAAAVYPDYLSGWLYITNARTALRLVRAATQLGFFWIDDAWLSGIVRERLQIPLLRRNAWFATDSQYLQCCVRDAFKLDLLCDYAIGPSSKDLTLISSFGRATAHCQHQQTCRQRASNRSLTKTCLGWHKAPLPAHGLPQVLPLKLG